MNFKNNSYLCKTAEEQASRAFICFNPKRISALRSPEPIAKTMYNKIKTACAALIFFCSPLMAQQNGTTQCGVPTNQPEFPRASYQELPDPHGIKQSDWKGITDWQATWGDIDTRYEKHVPPHNKQGISMTLEGWKGETLHAQAVTWSGKTITNLTFKFSEFNGRNHQTLPASAFSGGFVRYVMTDQLNTDGKGGCGDRIDHSLFDSLLVADCIDHTIASMSMEAYSVRPIWISCRIPKETVPGTYSGKVIIEADGKSVALSLKIIVHKRTLPDASQWAFHLDLWQNPFAVARYYKVPLWSQEHFEAMRPILKMLAGAGQKSITVSLMHKPWGGQTEDYFESMVTWIKKVDGTWRFDFGVFDKWVEFAMSQGIDQQINCYSMVPWKLSFQYFDQATNQMKSIQTAPGEDAYNEMWTAMLTSFSKHLKAKGWFDKCIIAMDERPREVMQQTLKLIRQVEPNFKVSLAGSYHKELEPELYDYCITIGETFPEEVKESRQKQGKVSTVYTCCAEAFPNTFTFSDPAEAAWIGYHIANRHLDGYLRWAYNSWVKEPLLDSRFRAWAAGDTYLVYPDARSSIRFDRLVEGIQAYEKVYLLRKEFKSLNNQRGLEKIEKILSPFKLKNLPQVPASKTVQTAQKALNSF